MEMSIKYNGNFWIPPIGKDRETKPAGGQLFLLGHDSPLAYHTPPHRMATSTTTSTAPPPDQPLRVRDLFAELGEARIQALSQEFYDRVYGTTHAPIMMMMMTFFFFLMMVMMLTMMGNAADEEEPWFRDMFAETAATPKDLAVFSQVSFFVQRFGGDPFYGGLQKDSAFVREVHHHFLINHKVRIHSLINPFHHE